MTTAHLTFGVHREGRLERRASVSADPVPFGRGSEYGFTLLKSGPEINAEEVELPDVSALEVLVLWGSNVLYVAHLTPARSFSVGEALSDISRCDFFVPSERIGAPRLQLIEVADGAVWAVIPPQADGFVELPGAPRVPLAEVQARAGGAGERRFPLQDGARVQLELGGFVFRFASVNAGKPLRRGPLAGWDWSLSAYFGLSLLSHASIVAALAFFMPPLNLTPDETLDRDRLYVLQQYLDAAAEREQLERTDYAPEDTQQRESGGGQQASGESGALGKPTVRAVNKRYAVSGPADNPDPHLARAAALQEAATFGLVALLTGDPKAPTAVFGRDTSLGRDEASFMGNMWGDELGDANGSGGLWTAGAGQGGGGRGTGVGLDELGTIGHGAGLTDGWGIGNGPGGFASGRGRLRNEHVTKSPRVALSPPTVSGRLPPEVIQRIVRHNFGRFRMCYEKGLTRNPNLAGRVAARFVIDRGGAVSSVSNGGSDLPDSAVVNCVLSAFYGLSFPEPQNGIVAVTYPILLAPG